MNPNLQTEPRAVSPENSAARSKGESDHGAILARSSGGVSRAPSGLLIVNADDWGRTAETTNKILDCTRCGAVTSASAMVFMEDSERAAALAREQSIKVGLHLNFTEPFSGQNCPGAVRGDQENVARHLMRSPFARAIFHPGLVTSFRVLVTAQVEEFRRLYGVEPERLDGHHHMHLSANVLLSGLLPAGTAVRRHFSFEPGEKTVRNSVFRLFTRMLLRRHRTTDYFFSLPPLEPEERLQRIFSLARHNTVELETHPVNPDEYRFLTCGEILKWAGDSFAGCR